MIFLMCPWIWLVSIYFCWKNLHLCSSRILICNFYLMSSWSSSCKVVLMNFWISLISVVMVHFFIYNFINLGLLFLLVHFIQVLSILLILSKSQLFVSLILYIVLCFHSIKSCPARLLSTHRLWVWLAHIFTRLQGTFLFIWHHSDCFNAAIKLPFRTTFIASHIICFVSLVLVIELRAPGTAGNQPTIGLWSQFLAIFLNRKTDML